MSHRTERRRRKKLREREDIPPALSAPLEIRGGRQGDVALFQDLAKIPGDLRLVSLAVNRDWDIQPEMQDWLLDEAMKIVDHTDGVSEYESDKNSIAACSLVFDMHCANRRAHGIPTSRYAFRLPRIRIRKVATIKSSPT